MSVQTLTEHGLNRECRQVITAKTKDFRSPVVASRAGLVPDALSPSRASTDRRASRGDATSQIRTSGPRPKVTLREVLELYRKRSGEMRPECARIFAAGAFLIQRLEGSGLELDCYGF